MSLLLAVTRVDIANYVQALVLVYTLIIFAYIVSQLLFSFGAKIPYSRWSDALLGFLRDVSEPYLRIFRRFIPMIGALDLSPIAAILVLNLAGNLIANAIAG